MTAPEATEAEVAELTACGWVPDVAGGRTHWLHREFAPVLGRSTRGALITARDDLKRRRAATAAGTSVDRRVMGRLRAPFGCELIRGSSDLAGDAPGRWRIHDANDDAIASVNAREEGYARLIVLALNEHFERRVKR
jgi:hypothetical protein